MKFPTLYQTAQPQVLLDDDVVDSGHDESNLHRIGSAGEVGVDLFGLVLVERDESVEDVVARCGVVWTTCCIPLEIAA
jgi:hypothetical protein